jgi:putative DNA primase/helicase
MIDIKEAARGHWQHILTGLGVDPKHLGTNRPCCLCGGTDRFSLTDLEGRGTYFCRSCGHGDGFDLLMSLNGWDFKRAAKEVERVLGVPQEVRFVSKPDPARALRRVYKGSRPVEDGDPVHLYLRNRGIDLLPKSLRFHPSLPVAGTHYPALVAVMRDVTGKAVTLHRTFIQDGQKAPVDTPRMLMTPVTTVTGACARLYPVDDAVLLAEGLETALSAMTLFSLRGWACISAHGLETIQLPETIKTVLIAADHDLNHVGAKAAYAAAERLSREGRKVRVEIPAIPSTDWNDELLLRRGRLS